MGLKKFGGWCCGSCQALWNWVFGIFWKYTLLPLMVVKFLWYWKNLKWRNQLSNFKGLWLGQLPIWPKIIKITPFSLQNPTLFSLFSHWWPITLYSNPNRGPFWSLLVLGIYLAESPCLNSRIGEFSLHGYPAVITAVMFPNGNMTAKSETQKDTSQR